jgi:benzoyl-CoA reductase/2-hydroxyglutaryl-CoA dehydratase subunit BcrC/BadD/HgdB
MSDVPKAFVGYTCTYTPLALIDAAGLAPYRVLPLEAPPDQAGRMLHDNLCPHVKRVLDRALAGDLPPLGGMVFVNSCDAMRRLADAWMQARPDDPVFVLDLPTTTDAAAAAFFAAELERLAGWLGEIAGAADVAAALPNSMACFNRLCAALTARRNHAVAAMSPTGLADLQVLYNRASTQTLEDSLAMLADAPEMPDDDAAPGVPVYLFGNVLPDPQAFALFAACGAAVVGEDVCTGSRMFQSLTDDDPSATALLRLARSLLGRPACARTFTPSRPGRIAEDILDAAQACEARGVIGHTLKFCDPYLARLPMIRETLKSARMPLLLLEGDCSLRTIGQQRTRIEAFIEMLR